MKYPPFEEAQPKLSHLGLWCFPVSLQQGKDGAWRKIPLDKWERWQARRPDKAITAYWLNKYPLAAAAVPTGKATVIVIDADNLEAIRWLNARPRGMPKTWATSTFHGTHYWFKPPSFQIHNTASAVVPGVDVRAEGGMAVLYHWLPGYSPNDVRLAELPRWFLKTLRALESSRQPVVPPMPAKPYVGSLSAWAGAALAAELSRLKGARNGTRHSTLLSVANKLGNLIGAGQLDEGVVWTNLWNVAQQWGSQPLSDSKRAIIDGIARGKLTPRAPAQSRTASI